MQHALNNYISMYAYILKFKIYHVKAKYITIDDGEYMGCSFKKISFRVYLVGVKTRRMENRKRKIGCIFHYLIEERKYERHKIWEKVFPLGPTFFILSNWEENEEGKVMRNAFYTNTPTLLHSPTPLTFPLLYNNDIIINLYKLYFPSSHFSL